MTREHGAWMLFTGLSLMLLAYSALGPLCKIERLSRFYRNWSAQRPRLTHAEEQASGMFKIGLVLFLIGGVAFSRPLECY